MLRYACTQQRTLYEKVSWRLYNVRLCQKVALVYVLQEGTGLQINRAARRSIIYRAARLAHDVTDNVTKSTSACLSQGGARDGER